MIRPIKVRNWVWNEEIKESVCLELGYLPGEFDDRGFLISIVRNFKPRPTIEECQKAYDDGVYEGVSDGPLGS